MDNQILEQLLAKFTPDEQDAIFVNVFELAAKLAALSHHIKMTLIRNQDCNCRYFDAAKVIYHQLPNFLRMAKDPAYMQRFIKSHMNGQPLEETKNFEKCVCEFSNQLDVIYPLVQKLQTTARSSLHEILINFLNLTLPLLKIDPTPSISSSSPLATN